MDPDRGRARTPAAQKIIDAAEKLFYECSIHAVGVEAIAAAAGVTKRTLYDRFDSKDAVIEAYLLQRHQRWLSRFDQRLAVSAPPRTGALFDSYFEDVADSSRGCAFLNAAAELPRNHPAMKVVHEHKRCVRKRLETLVSEDAPQLDAQSTADHLFLILEGAIAEHGLHPDRESAREAKALALGVLETSNGSQWHGEQSG
ncbi:TetR/AcrR family transcriptional regulator [Corynebacterium sp. ACRPO]|uniref:TetR/AcrR family transcriptional regulator n=1 Tax=Corynebacterium sp. ACRPO TaxID=2918200 RepID=UPI001EF43CF2|nr:TetR/AcrR family transcriptional regulator [Corynebacterium sp. ACRPO]MCG7445505.1 TetR/AcrR family transcriptional regulator [Corynebacterium sp. ACRPO]